MPNKDKNIPKRRFKEFENADAWELRKLGELGEIVTGSTPPIANEEYYSDKGIPWITPTDIETNIISDSAKKLSAEGAKIGRVVRANSILCTCIASIGKNALLTTNGSFNQQINSLTPYSDNDSYFLLTSSELWSIQMKQIASSGTMQIVNKTEFSELRTMIPSLPEQEAIGTFFSTLDCHITLHQRKLDKLKSVKQAYLSEMFPAEGERVPKRRFPGFTDAWELRKLGEVADIIGGGTPSTSNSEFWDGDIDWYTPAEIGEQIYVDGSERKITQLGLDKSSATLLPANKTILFTSRAGIGKTAILRSDATTNQGFQSIVVDNNTEPYFIFSMTDKIKNKAISVASGSTFAEISSRALGQLEFMFPSINEQKAIGTFFSTLDQHITLHQRKSI